jgi:hypothetical protein
MFKPRPVAVIGASRQPNGVARLILIARWLLSPPEQRRAETLGEVRRVANPDNLMIEATDKV